MPRNRRRTTVGLAAALALLLALLIGRWVVRAPEGDAADDASTRVAETPPTPAVAASLPAPPSPAPDPGVPAPPSSGDRAIADPASAPRLPDSREAPARPDPKRPGNAVVSGRIVDSVTGRPVAEATVRIHGPGGSTEGRKTRTDEDGRYRLEGLASEPFVMVIVEADGYVMRMDHRTRRRGTDDFNVSLAPAARIYGRVLDPEGQPVAGAAVYIDGAYGRMLTDIDITFSLNRAVLTLQERINSANEKETPLLPPDAVSDETGRFEVGEAPVAQSLTLIATADRYSPSVPVRDFVITPGSGGRAADLVLRPDTSLVFRIEPSSPSEPPAEVTVYVATPLGPRRALRRANGTLGLDGLWAGRTWYLADVPPFAAIHDSVELHAGRRTEVVLRPGGGARISGHVLDHRRTGVEGLRIALEPAVEGAPDLDLATDVVTDSTGGFTIPGLEEGRYKLHLFDTDRHFRMTCGIRVAPASGLELAAPGSLRFRIVPPRGEPPPPPERVAAGHSPEGGRYINSISIPRNLRYDPETGVAEVPRTFPGKTTLAVKVPDFVEVRRTMEVPAGGEADFGDVTLVPSLRARGRVHDDDGEPVPNAEVTAWYGNGVFSNAFTDLEGEFELRDLAPGEPTLEVYDAGHHGKEFALATPRVTVAAGIPPLDLTLVPGGVVRVRLLDAKGIPVTVAHVACEVPDVKYRPVPRSLDPSGEPGVYIGRRLPGVLEVQVLGGYEGLRPEVLLTRRIQVRDGKETAVELRLPE